MFKVVPSKPQFSVSIDGQIMWNATRSVLTPFKDKDGYLRITYRAKSKSHHIAVHRAVAEVYVINPDPLKYVIVNHLDSVRDNNSSSNLEWTTPSGNRAHCQFVGNHKIVGERHSQTVISESTANEICSLLQAGMRQVDICKMLGLERHIVLNIKHGKSWRSVSSKYRIDVPRKETMSVSTINWVKTKIEEGFSLEDLLELNPNLCCGDKERIERLLLVKCND
jgi:hypothetical protein